MGSPNKFHFIIPPQDVEQDPQCLEKIAAGDEKALEWLYKNYSRKMYGYALLLTGDQMVSEDIVQIVFSKIWENRMMMASVKEFTSYLHTMTRNYVTDYWRKQVVERRHLENFRYLAASIEVEKDHSKEVFKIIEEAVEKLPTRQKRIYQLKRDHNWKRERIATTLNISPNTVKATMQNALKNLKKQVQSKMRTMEDT